MEVLIANPAGFCAGVERAIEIVERAVRLFGAPVYVRHAVVHNRRVVDDLRSKGAVFVEEVDAIPPGATVVFSAHGVPQSVHHAAEERRLSVFDATCPLVAKVHMEVVHHHGAGREVVLIGHTGHPEVEGTLGQVEDGVHLVSTPGDVAALDVRDPDNLAFVTQTTLSVDDTAQVAAALRRRFPAIEGPHGDDICYATQNRQDAVKRLAVQVSLVLVVGSADSSNANRLVEVARHWGAEAYLVEDAAQIKPDWIQGRERVGLTAGASTPAEPLQEVIAHLRELGAHSVNSLQGVAEPAQFPLPAGL